MLLNKENRCFIKYLFTFSGIFNTLKFLIRKLYNKCFRKNDYHNYTKLFKSIFKRYGCNKKFDLFKNEINSSAKKYKILLATKPYLLDEKTDWNIKFDDEEDYESLHRFIWLRYLLSSEKSISTEEINFIENILFSWSNKFIHECFDDKSLVWHPYTLSERIINIIIFYVVSNRKMPISIQKNLHFMLSILIKRLEFYNYGHGNHLINNSRALLYYALYFDDEELQTVLKVNVLENIISNGITKSSVNGLILWTPLIDQPEGSVVNISIHAKDVILANKPVEGISARNIINASITDMKSLDTSVLVLAESNGVSIMSEITHESSNKLGLNIGEDVYLIIKTNSIYVESVPEL